MTLADKGQNPTIILPESDGYPQDPLNHLILAQVSSGKPLRYYTGAGWIRAGEFSTGSDWKTHVAAEAIRASNPVMVVLAH